MMMSDEEKKEIIEAMEAQDEKLLEKLIMELMKDEKGDDPMSVEVMADDKEGLKDGLEKAEEVIEGEEGSLLDKAEVDLSKGEDAYAEDDINKKLSDEELLEMLKANPDLMKQLMG